jgi:endonuclease/exonuclease/phosphatase family metal-dependent hydrolase
MASLASHPTFPYDAPRRQLDHVLADGPVHAAATAARRTAVSDHLALVVDLG